MLLTVFMLVGMVPLSVAATTILNVNFQSMNFGTPTLVSGTGGNVNAVYKYPAVFTIDSVTADALITIVEKVNATLDTIDLQTNVDRFEP